MLHSSLRSRSQLAVYGLVILLFVAGLFSCQVSGKKSDSARLSGPKDTIKIYSPEIRDSFSIFISLPEDYSADARPMFPVVYVLDANVYFNVFKAIVHNYSEVGLVPPVILVGIGYNDLGALDSLRSRDYTFPLADPAYEMPLSGKAGSFLQFLERQLIPYIDTNYPNDIADRTLFGHSLAGYFVDYALLKHLETGHQIFANYIAASPSLYYNRYYLPDQLKRWQPSSKSGMHMNHYLSYGLLEDEEDDDQPEWISVKKMMLNMNDMFQQKRLPGIRTKATLFSGMSHMETAIPSFIQGLNWIYTNNADSL